MWKGLHRGFGVLSIFSYSSLMSKLFVLPAFQQSMGGITVSLSLMLEGFNRCEASNRLCVLVMPNSLLDRYLRDRGSGHCLQPVAANSQSQFTRAALSWVAEQPRKYPLLLGGFGSYKTLLILARAIPKLRSSGRPIYHFFYDLAHSYNPVSNWMRKLVFASLAPEAICNSQFTAHHVHQTLGRKICGVLYQPVDLERFHSCSQKAPPPENLRPILDSGARILLTPSRIVAPEEFNDKNLRGLIPLLARLKERNHFYHGVVIGEDFSPQGSRTRALLELARRWGVGDRFTVLPPTFAIRDYYQYADFVVTLAPREPFGRTVVEAIACGVPVVGSHSGGVGETLGHFAPHWRVDPFDPDAAAEAIVRIAADAQTARVLSDARRWVELNCAPAEYAQRMMEIVGLPVSSPVALVNSLQ